MTTKLLIQIINAFLNGCCRFVETMQANPLGAFVLMVITVIVALVVVVWLLTRHTAGGAKRQAAKKRAAPKPDAN